jgi:hypothetical protein
MANIHIISDLNLGYNQHSNPEDEVIPADCDLLVINGNIGTHIKRSMLFVETMCHKYPHIPVIYNLGKNEGGYHDERQGKNNNVGGLLLRQQISSLWPKNLHFSPLQSLKLEVAGKKYDIMCAFGFPKIISADNWEDSVWYKTVSFGTTTDHSLFRPAGAAEVWHGSMSTRVTVEEINQRHNEEQKIIRDWELDYDENSGYKILITAISPIRDPRCEGLSYIMYPEFHLYQRLWITGGIRFSGAIVRGANLVSNPGSGFTARQHLITA